MLEELYRKNRKKYIALADRVVKNKADAEDAVQEAFIKAIKYFDSFDENKGKLTSWFSFILWHCAIDILRKKEKAEEDNIDFYKNICDTIDYPSRIHNRVDIELINEAQPSIVHQKIVYLYYLRQYTTNDISSITGETENNIRQICTRFRQRVRNAYGFVVNKNG